MHWKKIYRSILTASVLLSLNIGFVSAAPITIEEQGSFTVGGSYKQHAGKFTQENSRRRILLQKMGRGLMAILLMWSIKSPSKPKSCR